jgi:hypothetical protein
LITTGVPDAWVVPTATRKLYSTQSADRQGHIVIVSGPNPGQLLFGTQDFIPFVRDPDTGYLWFPMLPPPTQSNLVGDHPYSSMSVLNLNTSVDTGTSTQESQANEKVLRKKMRVKKKSLNVISRGTLLPWLNVKRRKCIEFRRRQYLEKQRTDVDKRAKQEEAYHQYHRACGHINMKNLIRFKRIGSVRTFEIYKEPEEGLSLV